MLNKSKLYIIPMKFVCNAKCHWCLSKQNQKSNVREKMELDQLFLTNFAKSLHFLKQYSIEKIEFTGGGEPFLNEFLSEIILLIKNHYLLLIDSL